MGAKRFPNRLAVRVRLGNNTKRDGLVRAVAINHELAMVPGAPGLSGLAPVGAAGASDRRPGGARPAPMACAGGNRPGASVRHQAVFTRGHLRRQSRTSPRARGRSAERGARKGETGKPNTARRSARGRLSAARRALATPSGNGGCSTRAGRLPQNCAPLPVSPMGTARSCAAPLIRAHARCCDCASAGPAKRGQAPLRRAHTPICARLPLRSRVLAG